MDDYQRQQKQIFLALLRNKRLTLSAKRQVKIFINILKQENGIGFDTTTALLYGFIRNEEFTDKDFCPLTSKQLIEAKKISRYEATRNRAHETALLNRVARLPLANAKDFGAKIDLKDLAVSFLTYASDEPYFAYSYIRNQKLYKYLNISNDYYLNVYNLREDLKKIGMSIDDFIVNLSRLKTKLWIPDERTISISYDKFLRRVASNLPKALLQLNSNALEDLIMDLFDRAGYQVVRIGRNIYEKDGGVDIIAYNQDILTGDMRFAIQCKATKNKIETRTIREFNTSLQNFNSNKGVFITTSIFTPDANDEVDKYKYPIELMDYIELSNKIRIAIQKK